MESSGGKKSVTLIDGRGEHFLFSPPRDNTGSRKKKNINNLQTTFGREIAKSKSARALFHTSGLTKGKRGDILVNLYALTIDSCNYNLVFVNFTM